MVSLLNLPIELYGFIFEFINLRDLTNLRGVSKRFRSIVDECGSIEELVITNGNVNERRYAKDWSYSDRPINFENLIKLDLSKSKELNYFKREIINQKLIKNLRRLKLIFKLTNQNQNILNYYIQKLTKLKQLDIRLINYKDDKFILKHSNLKQFFIANYSNNLRNVKINLPKLEILFIPLLNGKILNLDYDKIKGVFIFMYNTHRYEIDLFKFKNLESIVVLIYKDSSNLDILFQMPKLKLIKFLYSTNIEIVTDFYKKKEKLKRDDLIIYLEDYKLSNSDDIEKYRNYYDDWD